MSKAFRVAVVGVTGAVGREVLKTLKARDFQIAEFRGFASKDSVEAQAFSLERAKELADSFDFVFFTAGSAISEKYIPLFKTSKAWVIDNSSFFRMRSAVPLVVPEVNGDELKKHFLTKQQRLVANPNCTTAQTVMALKPLHDFACLKRVLVTSYQAVSGKGQKGIQEFKDQLNAHLSGNELKVEAFPRPIVFNCIPQIDLFSDDGFTGEERKVIQETQKILNLQNLRVAATCVRVPVFNGHSVSVAIETEKELSVEQARILLSQFRGVEVVDDPKNNLYPIASDASGKDQVMVGRIRNDPSTEGFGLLFWVVADNLRKGAALNAVQIAEYIAEEKLW